MAASNKDDTQSLPKGLKNPIVVIPARMASTRLPGKPLADIGGKPMIVRVMEQAQMARIGPVVVAAGEQEIVDAITEAGGQAVLTDPALLSGSDRIFAALEQIDPEKNHDVVINLQGDLPLIDPGIIKLALLGLALDGADIATLVAGITDPAELSDPNVVKAAVGFDKKANGVGRAIYFSRLAVPGGDGPHYHHIGIYAFRRSALERFINLPPSMLEVREKLEQLRALENGMTIGCALVDTVPFGVDTPGDLERAREIIKKQNQ
ncbi:MAG: 3-deoxy-manno-octulosonate cytidylyltransferase, partial [Rhodospirillaceae bacterium]|nr:3-deoxy-manno-octulosonate cytidylyltransferase [Rhodospirillaceae bacterium]